MDPDRGEIIRHAERDGVLSGLKAAHRLEPHVVNIFREQPFQIAFDGFPESGLERKLGHGGGGVLARIIHTSTPVFCGNIRCNTSEPGRSRKSEFTQNGVQVGCTPCWTREVSEGNPEGRGAISAADVAKNGREEAL